LWFIEGHLVSLKHLALDELLIERQLRLQKGMALSNQSVAERRRMNSHGA